MVAPKQEINRLALMTKPKEGIAKKSLSNEIVSKRDAQFFLVKSNGKYGIEDESRKLIVDYKYEKIDSSTVVFQGRPYFIVGNNNLFGAVNLNADLVVPIRYSSSGFARAALVKAVDTIPNRQNQ